MTFEELEEKVVMWADNRNIFSATSGSSARTQMKKLAEEMMELHEAIIVGGILDIVDGIGDMLVVLAIIAEFEGTDLTRCFYDAYDQIKDRKGKMVNGLFVKEQ